MIVWLAYARTPIRHPYSNAFRHGPAPVGSRQGIMHRVPVQSRRQGAVFTTILVLAVGCGPQPSGTTDALPGEGGATVACPEIDLRAPNGDPLNLTGTWFGDDGGDYFLTQRESCLHWLGMSPAEEGAQAGSSWTNVYVGRISPDFTIDGEFADVPYQRSFGTDAPNSGELTLEVGFFGGDGGDEWPSLHVVEYGGPGLGGLNWVPEDVVPERAEYVGTYGYEAGCPWLEVNGERYEIKSDYDFAAGGQLLGEGNQIVARPGDTLRVDGQIWPTTIPDGCLPDRLLGWSVEVGP